jgi:hypothetical protein
MLLDSPYIVNRSIILGFLDAGLVRASAKCQQEARVIVGYRKRMATLAICEHEVAFEVHLPKLVWALHAEAGERPVFARLGRVKTSMTSQDRCYCAWSWELMKSLVGKEAGDLPSSPGVVQIAGTKYSILCSIVCAGWRVSRTPGAVCKS